MTAPTNREPSQATPAVPAREAAGEGRTIAMADTGPALAEPAGVRRFGDYELLEEVARGGMGVVYKARQVSLDRIVAVKMILAGELASRETVERFRGEAAAVARLDHPGIVPIYEVGAHEGQHFFSMGFVDGTSLAAELAGGPLAPREAARLVQEVAEAVQHAHDHGVIHRDLKPGNVLLDKAGHARVTDFGLAKRTEFESHLTTTGQVLGTPSFMSPEQAAARWELVGPPTDVYALGAILYNALTGRPPFQAASLAETLQQVLEREPVPPRVLNPHIPRDLETITLRCLAKTPARRCSTARELAAELQRFLSGEPIRSRPVGRPERVWRWCCRRPLTAALLLAVQVLLGIVLVGGPVASVVLRHQRNEALANLLRARQAEADSKTHLRRAEDAEASLRLRLAESYLAQARAVRYSRRPGQRFEALEAVRQARELTGPTPALAQEAVAALGLADMVVARTWDGFPAGTLELACDETLEKYARADLQGRISLRRVADDAELAAWAGGIPPAGYRGLEFSPDGRWLHVLGGSGESARARLYRIDVAPPQLVLDGRHFAFAFSPDSRQLAVCQQDGAVHVLDTATGRAQRQLAIRLPVRGFGYVWWNPRHPQLAVNLRSAWCVLDLERDELQPEVPMPVSWLAWHPDGRHLAVATDQRLTIEIYDTQTRQLAAPVATGHTDQGVVLWFNRAGDLLVSNDWTDVRRVWDPGSGTELLRLPAADHNALMFRRDDRQAGASVSGRQVETWRVAAGAEHTFRSALATGADANRYQYRAVISAAGRLLAVQSKQGVALLDTAWGRELAILPGPIPVAFLPGNALRTCGPAGLQEHPFELDLPAARLRLGTPRTLVPVPSGDPWGQDRDGTVLAMPLHRGGFSITRLGPPLRTVAAPPLPHDVRSCAVSPDGRWLATGSHHPNPQQLTNARVWNSTTGQLIRTLPVSELCTVQFSPGGTWLATASRVDNECRLWQVGTWQPGPRFSRAVHVAFSADDRLLALGGPHGKVLLCETATGREIARLSSREMTALWPQCFAPDGSRVYAIGVDNGLLHVWDLRQIRQGLEELGLAQGWPEFPPPPPGEQSPTPLTVLREPAPPDTPVPGPTEGRP